VTEGVGATREGGSGCNSMCMEVVFYCTLKSNTKGIYDSFKNEVNSISHLVV